MKTFICILILSPILIFAQWEKRTNGLPDDLFGLAIDACDSNTAVISVRLVGPEKIYLTTDAGNNWKDISPFTEDFDEATDISMIDKNNINSERMPDYHSLNIRFDKRFLFDNSNIILYLSIWNVYGRENISEFYWDEVNQKKEYSTGWGTLPIIGVEWEF